MRKQLKNAIHWYDQGTKWLKTAMGYAALFAFVALVAYGLTKVVTGTYKTLNIEPALWQGDHAPRSDIQE